MRGAIHQITIHHLTGSTRNAEGVATSTYTDTRILGRAQAMTDQELWVAEQRGYTANCAVHLPADATVLPSDEVTVSGTGVLALDGRYTVVEVGGFQTHQRITLKQFQLPEVTG